MAERNQTFSRFTRPANTTTYAAADVIADSASAATIQTFTGCAEPGGGGLINSCILIQSAAVSTKLVADLFLFHTAPTAYGNDNAAFTPTDAEMDNCVGVVTIDGSVAGNVKIGSGNVAIQSLNIGIVYKTAVNDGALYGVLVARNAYVPTSA